MLSGICVVINQSHPMDLLMVLLKRHEFITLEGKGGITIQCIQLTLVELHCDYELANESIVLLNKFQEKLHGLHEWQHTCMSQIAYQ